MMGGFRLVIEPETGAQMIATRRQAMIADGKLEGSEITTTSGGYRVWTARTRLARELAERHGLKLRLWDGEADLFVPDALAAALLPRFGARTRRTLTDEQRAACVSRLDQARNKLAASKKSQKTGLLDTLRQ
jgi:hypothetical protein